MVVCCRAQREGGGSLAGDSREAGSFDDECGADGEGLEEEEEEEESSPAEKSGQWCQITVIRLSYMCILPHGKCSQVK